MSMEDRLSELKGLRNGIEASSVARQRIEALLDYQSFVEMGAFVTPRTTNYNMTNLEAPADGVVTGYGTMDGRLVYVYSQDPRVIGGALGEMHAKKIVAIYKMAIKVGAPVIGLLDSTGMRLQEGSDAFEGYGQIFIQQSLASGVIPQITAILGTCGGGAAIIPSLSDFVFMTKEHTSFYLNSVNTLDGAKDSTDPVGSAQYHGINAGIVDVVCEDEVSLFGDLKALMALFPSNNSEEAPYGEGTDDFNRDIAELNTLDPLYVDGRNMVGQIADAGTYFEVSSEYGEDVATVIARLGGMTVGFIASSAKNTEGRLSLEGAEKVAAFVNKMDAFSLPVITLVDTKGFEASIANERAGQAKYVAAMIAAYTNATVPLVTLLMNNAVGSAYVAMNSKHIGADVVYAWPNAKVGTMNPESAVKIMYAEEIAASLAAPELIREKINRYTTEEMSPYKAASHGYIDDIIEPSATRKRLIAAVDMLFTKYVNGPDRKHRSV